MKNKKYKIFAGILTVLLCMFIGCKKEETIYLTSVEETAENVAADGTVIVEGSEVAENAAAAGNVSKTDEAVIAEGSEKAENAVAAAAGANVSAAEKNGQEDMSVSEEQKMLVHICGAVRNPGVYEVSEEERIYHAVEKAGGFTEEADADYLNQAQKLADGMQIYIPTREEVLELSKNGEIKEIGIRTDETKESGGITDESGETASGNLVNINTATKEELCTLPGIGEGKAQKIIDYRTEAGNFRSIEEIMNVEGIKQGVFDKMKDSITVS